MTDQFSPLAVQNASLLRAIAAGPHASVADLAAAAEVAASNIARKIASLVDEGLVSKTGEANHEVELTPLAVRSLEAIDLFEGRGGGPRGLPLHLIRPNPFQPRTDDHGPALRDEAGDAELARSIADKGVLQPIIVRPMPDGTFQQALGHRRLRAALLAVARDWLPASFTMPAEVRDLTDEDMEEIALVENVQRSDLHWMDEAQAYLRLANRGKSAGDIIRLIGAGGRKKRGVQDLIQIARELPAADVPRCYLPDGNVAQLTYTMARGLVGNKRAAPALDLNPRLTVALLEVLDCGDYDPDAAFGEVATTALHAAPISGPLITLNNAGHIKIRFEAGEPVADVPITEALVKHLADLGFDTDRADCLYRVRANLDGEMAAGSHAASGQYMTPELNAAAREDAPLARRGPEVPDREAYAPPHLEDATPTEDSPPAPRIEPSPALALLVLEVAHKTAADPVELQAGVYGCAVTDAYRHDPAHQEAVMARLLLFRPKADKAVAMLTPHAQAWLDQEGTERDPETGLAVIDEGLLLYLRLELHPEAGAGYATEWLRPPAATLPTLADQVKRAAAETEAEASAIPPPPGAGDREAGGGATASAPPPETPQTRALQRQSAALNEAKILLASATTRKLKPAEVEAVTALIEGAAEAGAAALAVPSLVFADRATVNVAAAAAAFLDTLPDHIRDLEWHQFNVLRKAVAAMQAETAQPILAAESELPAFLDRMAGEPAAEPAEGDEWDGDEGREGRREHAEDEG